MDDEQKREDWCMCSLMLHHLTKCIYEYVWRVGVWSSPTTGVGSCAESVAFCVSEGDGVAE